MPFAIGSRKDNAVNVPALLREVLPLVVPAIAPRVTASAVKRAFEEFALVPVNRSGVAVVE